MDTRDTLQGVLAVMPSLPLEGVETMLVSFEMLVGFGGSEVRPWASEHLKQAAERAAYPGVRERLLRAAAAVEAGQSCAETPAPYQEPAPNPNLSAEDAPEPAEATPKAEVIARPVNAAERAPRKPSKLREFKSLNARKASVVTLGGFKPTFDPLATKFGFKPVARANESWPAVDGRPMLFVCQLNLTAAPFVPPSLEDIKLLTFFLDFSGRSDGDGATDWRFEMRTYSSTDGLVTLEPPSHTPALRKGFECKWESVDDYPCHEDPDAQNPRDLDAGELELPNSERTKIGGWPNLIQSELCWQTQDHPAKPVYCLQIASEEKAAVSFGDAGTLYLARGAAPGHEDQWFLDWQSL